MKSLLASVCLAILFLSASGQKAPLKYGSVPIDALSMTTYDKDSSAAAVILGDYGISTIKYSVQTGFSLQFERTTRIKIFTKDGFEWGNFEIPLYSNGSADEKVTGLKAITFNLENGKIVESKAKSESIFKEQVNENLKITKVAFPNVKEGSVLDITYIVNSEFITHFQDWQFQYTIPVVWTEYRANIPEWFSYDKYMQGYVPLLAERQYPVDYGSSQESFYICTFSIPEGYAVDEVPQVKIFSLPENAAKFTFNVANTGTTFMITSIVQINRNIFSQEEYPNLREFYNLVVAKQAEQIVLKKL